MRAKSEYIIDTHFSKTKMSDRRNPWTFPWRCPISEEEIEKSEREREKKNRKRNEGEWKRSRKTRLLLNGRQTFDPREFMLNWGAGTTLRSLAELCMFHDSYLTPICACVSARACVYWGLWNISAKWYNQFDISISTLFRYEMHISETTYIF